jgi:hypothetical protein
MRLAKVRHIIVKNSGVAAVLLLSIVIAVTLTTLSPHLQARTVNINSNSSNNINHGTLSPTYSPVFSADSKPYNLTYGEWTARWWQWGYSVPKYSNPAYDDTGKNCAQGQRGPVWFLAGAYGHPVNRVCSIQEGKAILFPILNSECSFAEFPKLKTLSQLHTCAKTIQDHVTKLYASVDGIPIPHLQEYRIVSPPFNFTLPQNNILGMPANTNTQAIADGNCAFLKPLSPGIHKLIFKGGVQESKIVGTSNNNVSNSSGSGGTHFAFPSGWDFQTTYNLTVKK